MLTLIQSPEAEEDLIDIWLYIAEDQPVNANRFLDRLNDAILLLAQTPNLGSDRPELLQDIKVFPVDRYNIYYRIKTDMLEVVRVLSASRDVTKLNW